MDSSSDERLRPTRISDEILFIELLWKKTGSFCMFKNTHFFTGTMCPVVESPLRSLIQRQKRTKIKFFLSDYHLTPIQLFCFNLIEAISRDRNKKKLASSMLRLYRDSADLLT